MCLCVTGEIGGRCPHMSLNPLKSLWKHRVCPHNSRKPEARGSWEGGPGRNNGDVCVCVRVGRRGWGALTRGNSHCGRFFWVPLFIETTLSTSGAFPTFFSRVRRAAGSDSPRRDLPPAGGHKARPDRRKTSAVVLES